MKKLGRLLVDRGWITSAQLTRALQAQRLVGGRLGTCLLEMDALSEDLLLKALSEQQKVPAANVEELRAIPPEVLSLVPARLAIRCQAVPFRLLGGAVEVALLDVGNLAHQDDLAFVTGRRVKVHVANEARIYEALEHHYGQECPARFVRLLDRLNRARYMWQKPEGTPARAPETPTWASPESVFPEEPASPSAGGPSRPPAGPPPRPAPRVTTRPVQVTAEAAAPAASQEHPAPRPAPEEKPAHRPRRSSLGEVEDRLAGITSTEEIGRVVLDYLAGEFRRAALFQVKKNRVAGWMGAGEALDPDRLKGFKLGFDQPSVFLNLKEGGAFFLGPLPEMPAHRALARCWGGEIPPDSVLVPVRIKDRLVSVLYGDQVEEGLAGLEVHPLQRLANKAAIAFELCIMRNKLKKA